jgi:hypothetical protein
MGGGESKQVGGKTNFNAVEQSYLHNYYEHVVNQVKFCEI